MKHFWKEILEYGPRSVGTPAHDRVTDYIFNESWNHFYSWAAGQASLKGT